VVEGQIVDFYDGWVGNRSYPLDMAGFAFSTQLFLEASKKVILSHFKKSSYVCLYKKWMGSVSPKGAKQNVS